MHSDNGVPLPKGISIAYISIGNYDAGDFADACRGLGWIDMNISAVCENSESLYQDSERLEDFLDGVRKADLTVMKIHGDRSYFPSFVRLFDAVAESKHGALLLSSSPYETVDHRRLFPYPDEEYDLAISLLKAGGVRNYTALFLWACKTISGMDVVVPGPEAQTPQGIYSTDDIPPLRSDGRPVIGLMMSHMIWRRQEALSIDRLISVLGASGADVIPIFFKSIKDTDIGSTGVVECAKRYFMKGRRPIVDVIVASRGFSQTVMGSDDGGINPFAMVGVPVIQCPTVYGTVEEWSENTAGLSSNELSASSVQTEYDGQIDGVPLQFVSGRGKDRVCEYVPDRVDRIANMAMAWSRLRRKPRDEVKVAIILNHPSRGRAGASRGLATFESVRRILTTMSKRGYSMEYVPKTQTELTKLLGISPGCDLDWFEGTGCADAGNVPVGTYRSWFEELPRYVRDRMTADSDGTSTLSDTDLPIPGIVDGNVFIGFEPNCGTGPHGAVSHQYLAFYRWIEESFGADAIIHMGDHGMLEWLPGKSAGLSSSCMPDVILRSSVLIYPFAVDDPGNGTVAKRRAHAVLVSHMVPPETRCGIPPEMSELQALLQQSILPSVYGGSRDDESLERIRELMDSLELWGEVSLNRGCEVSELEKAASRVYDRISELRDERIRDGLHVFGVAPRGRMLAETVLCAMENPNGSIPSVTDILSRSEGRTGCSDPASLMDLMMSLGFDRERCLKETGLENTERAEEFVEFVCDRLVPALRGCSGEMDSLMNALEGRFVPPGPGGSPFYGNAQVLPTGRNISAIDARAMPTRIGWITGSRTAEETVVRFFKESGRMPGRIAVFINGGGTLANGGADLAAAIRLTGLRPIWRYPGGPVSGLEEIPPEDLGRPPVEIRLCMPPVAVSMFDGILDMLGGSLGYDPVENDGSDVDAVIAGRGMYENRNDTICFDAKRMAERVPGCRKPTYIGNRVSDHGRARSALEESATAIRTRIANPEWTDGLIPYGADGVSALAEEVERFFELGRSEDATEPWMYRSILESLLRSDGIVGWAMGCNPAFLMETADGLAEAAEKGNWDPSEGEIGIIRKVFLRAEEAAESSTTRCGGKDGQQGA